MARREDGYCLEVASPEPAALACFGRQHNIPQFLWVATYLCGVVLLLLLLPQLLDPCSPDCGQFVVRHSSLNVGWLVGCWRSG